MEQRGRLKFKFVTDKVDYEFKVKDAIRPDVVNRLKTITNLERLDDEFVKREISQEARSYIQAHTPRRVA